MGHGLWIHNLELAIRYFDDIDSGMPLYVIDNLIGRPAR
jgi:hypothetical protein